MTTTTDYHHLTGKYVLNPSHTQIGFAARHAMVTKVRGTFNEFSGTVHLDGENPERSSSEVTIQATSIDPRNTDRDEHLRSNDFRYEGRLPGDHLPDHRDHRNGPGHHEVTGDLTIKGITRSVIMPFTLEGQTLDPFGNTHVSFEGSTTINRKDFGITWNAGWRPVAC